MNNQVSAYQYYSHPSTSVFNVSQMKMDPGTLKSDISLVKKLSKSLPLRGQQNNLLNSSPLALRHYSMVMSAEKRMRNKRKLRKQARKTRESQCSIMPNKMQFNNNIANKGKVVKRAVKIGRGQFFEVDQLTNDTTNYHKKIRKTTRSTNRQSSMPSYHTSEVVEDSVTRGQFLFKWLIAPVEFDDFFATSWERRPLFVRRDKKDYYADLFSVAELNQMLKVNDDIMFSTHVDVTTYDENGRQTLNPEGRAYAPIVWDFYKRLNCSIRLLRPQAHSESIWNLCSTLQFGKVFGVSTVGANVYLTPRGVRQGFAPHYDDVDVFILQIEGSKRWLIYEPRTEAEVLARHSSPDFRQDQLGDPTMDIVIQAGDMLYLPRGTIHQAHSLEGEHSLHVTLSAGHLSTFADLIEVAMAKALRTAAAHEVDLRRGLPLDILDVAGCANRVSANACKRMELTKLMSCMADIAIRHLDLDYAVDQLGKRLMCQSVPPKLTHKELCRTVNDASDSSFPFGRDVGRLKNLSSAADSLDDEGSICSRDKDESVDMTEETEVRLLRANILHLVKDESGSGSEQIDDITFRVYFASQNSRDCRRESGEEDNYLIMDSASVPVVEYLIACYPKWVAVKNLPLGDSVGALDVTGECRREDDASESVSLDEMRLNIVQDLWEHNLLMTHT